MMDVDCVDTEQPSSENLPPSPERPVRRSRSAKRGRYRRYPANAKLRANLRRNAAPRPHHPTPQSFRRGGPDSISLPF